MKELTLEAKIENVGAVTEFIDAELEKLDCSFKAQTQLDVAIDELFSNVANYAYGEGSGNVSVAFEHADGVVTITFIDSGIPYNPLNAEDPDITLSAEERGIGGLGIFLVKKTMDDVRYEYRDGQNILSIVKKIS